MGTVERIGNVSTDASDRPEQEIKIVTATVLR